MQQNISDRKLYEILGADLSDSDMIDSKMEEAYAIIRKQSRKKRARKGIGRGRRKALFGLSSAAAILVLAFAFCVMNPVLASEIPILGSLFAKVADVFRFGEIPEEKSETLYEGDKNGESSDGDTPGVTLEETESPYRVTAEGITVTLEEQYISNQAIFVGIRIENEEEFPEMAAYVESGTQWLDVRTEEKYSFRPEPIMTRRKIEGKFEDAHTFIGIMRIDFSNIAVDDSKYAQAIDEADAKGEEYPEINHLTWDEWMDYYAIPDPFEMKLEIRQIIGTLNNPTRPEGMKSDEELSKMTDEEVVEYRNSLPREWVGYPNVYQHWYQDGSWRFELTLTQTDETAETITVNESNEAGLGIESIELSAVEMTVNTIEKTTEAMATVVFDADGMEIPYEGDNAYAISGHDISTISVYICRFDDWDKAMTAYEEPTNDKSFQELIERCALFETKVLIN